jgi:DNA mismatch repair protein MutS2
MERMREQVENRKSKVDRRTEKREARQPKPASPKLTPTPESKPPAFWSTIEVGDQVRLDGGAVGEVMEVSGKEAVLALGQIRTRVKLKRLEKVGGPRKQRVEVRAPGGGSSGVPASSAKSKIDVRGQRAEAALSQVERLVDEALAAGLHRVEVLHGKGTGALRLAVLGYLQDRPDVTCFEEAEWDAGGSGVTVIDLS